MGDRSRIDGWNAGRLRAATFFLHPYSHAFILLGTLIGEPFWEAAREKTWSFEIASCRDASMRWRVDGDMCELCRSGRACQPYL
jgi:hypothetical protein